MSGALGNAAFVDLGNRTLLFDTTESPVIARDLRAAAEQLTGHPIGAVVISHGHSDHWYGNQVFAGLPIIATTRSLDMETFVPGHGPVGGKAHLGREKQYIVALQTMAKEAIAAGRSLDDLLKQRLPVPLDAWSADGMAGAYNWRFVYERMSSAANGPYSRPS